MEWWNLGILEENLFGIGAGLCAIGTQARARPIADIPQHSNIPIFQHSNEVTVARG
jgi:hypothetical protein